MFNNITSTLLSGDSSEKLIWTLCSVLCGSCLHLNNCVTDQLSTWAQVAGQVSCNIQSIYLILMYRSVVGLHPSLRSWWFVWREGKTLRKRAQSLRFPPYTPRGFVGHLRALQAKPPATQATILTK